VVAVGRQPAEVGRTLLHQVHPPVGEVRRYLDAYVRHEPPALADEQLHIRQRDRRGPVGPLGLRLRAAFLIGLRPPFPRRLVGDLRHLAPVVPGMRHEVLEDHLLDVPVTLVHRRERLE
jgi:hypothetical protein